MIFTPYLKPKYLKNYIDYELQFEKTLLDPIRFILQPIGWTPEPKASLEAFF